MIISRINGGLGNQMFQYAFGRALAIARGTDLSVGLDAFRGYTLHNGFELARIFDINAHTANESDYRKVLGVRGIEKNRRALIRKRFSWFRGSRVVVEPHYHYWEDAAGLPEDCYVVGYWQSERYFQAFQDLIREDFSFRTPMSPQNQKTYDKISSCEAISLHIRRGDYISDQNTFNTHGVCSMDYYEKALEFIYRQCNNPVLFVFSDDMAWVKENFNFDKQSYFIENNCGDDSYNDMRLMSSCKHHILANSSFSWWGAWLNSSAEKVVVTPRCWFASDRFDTRDLIPAEWIKL
jgi:hypothetical protein